MTTQTKNKRFRFKFVGRQTGAIGITYTIWEAYDTVKNLGEALYKLYTDYELIRGLQCWDTTNRGYADCWDDNQISKEVLSTTELVKVPYHKRESSPNTGTYKYNRYDAPDNYKW